MSKEWNRETPTSWRGKAVMLVASIALLIVSAALAGESATSFVLAVAGLAYGTYAFGRMMSRELKGAVSRNSGDRRQRRATRVRTHP